MIEAKHTPGPWRFAEKELGSIVAGDEDTPNLTKTERAFYGGKVICESVSPENRPLLLAAPDLFDALFEALANVERVTDGGRKASPELAQWLTEARAAISKAKGES